MAQRIWALTALAWLTACAPEITEDPRPATTRVSAVFDPATATLPLPNSAALDGDGTLPDRGGEEAQGEFNAWLSKSSGWDRATPIVLPFSGGLDASTITSETVQLYEVSAAGELMTLDATLNYIANSEEAPVCAPSVCGAVIRVTPAEPLGVRKRYAVLATRGLKGADGLSVLPSTAMFMAASKSPLVDSQGQSTVASVDSGTAARLESVRRLLSPVLDELARGGVEADDVVTATVWGTSENAFTILDPATSTLPIPNTLALDADQTFPRAALAFCPRQENAAACSEDSDCTGVATICQQGLCTPTRCAQGTFDTYLDGLHGWPPTTPVTLPVTAEINSETLNQSTVQMWRLGETLERVEATPVFNPETRQIVLQLAQPMDLNTRYVAFATQGVEATNGLPLLPPPAVAMSVQPYPVVDGEGNSLVAEIPQMDALRIEAVRALIRPLVEAVAAKTGVSHGELAAIWTWNTWTDSFVAFDPSAAKLAFPNAFLTAGCTGDRPICALYNPASPPADPLQAQLFDELSQRTGFSTTSTNWLPTDGPPLQANTVNKDNVLVAEAQQIPPPPLEADEYEVRFEFGHILVDFNRPLLPETLIAGIATNNMLGENGFPAQPSPAFVFLRSEYPLVNGEGQSLVSSLDDATASLLEGARQQYSQLWLVAQILGYSRTQVVSAWAYTTQKTYEPLQQLRAQALAKLEERPALNGYRACDPDCVDDPNLLGPLPEDATIEHPNDPTVMVDMSNVEWIQWNGEIESVSFLDPNRRLVGYDEATEPRLGVSVFVPRAANCTAPFDVVIAQHGNSDWRYNMGVAMANTLAEQCILTVAIDLPLHGGRSPSSTTLHPEERPADSGEGFIGLDLVGTKGSLFQATIDLSVLVAHIRAGALDDMVGFPVADETSQIGYVGISMGGFVGTVFSALEPNVGPTVLNVAGGNYGVFLRDSETFSDLLSGTGLEPATFGYLQILHFIQWLGEQADPYVFARHLTRDPLKDVTYNAADDSYTEGQTMGTKEVLVQMAEGDPTVPNSSTELLARELGLSLEDTTFEGVTHGFLVSEEVTTSVSCVREQSATWIRSGFDGDATLPQSLTAPGCQAQ